MNGPAHHERSAEAEEQLRSLELRVLGDPEQVVIDLGLSSGFNLADWPAPKTAHPKADDLATRLLYRAAKSLADAIPESGITVEIGGRARLLKRPMAVGNLDPDELNNLSAAFNGGIPLAFLCSADEGWADWKTSMLLFARANPDTQSERRAVVAELADRMDLEQQLWEAADEPRIPFPIAQRTVDWLWDSDQPDGEPPSAFPCLRCGRWTTTARRTKNLPLCDYCRDKKVYTAEGRLIRLREPSTWPPHAIMPATRGTWWIQCDYPACSKVIEARQQRHRCPEHQDHRMDVAKRLSGAGMRSR